LALAVRRLEELQERRTAWLAAHEEELFAGVGVDGERRS
jgi:hypothetical protein